MSMGDAMMNRPLIASLETVLRHRQRNTRKQRSQKRDNLQGAHLHTPLSLNSPRRADENALQGSMVFDLDRRFIRIVVSGD